MSYKQLGATARGGGFRNGANGNGHAAARAPKPQRVLTFVGATTKSGGARHDAAGKRINPSRDPATAKRRRDGAPPAAAPAEADASTTASAVAARRFWAQAAAGRSSGLVNLGNTCFLNATIQCLAHTPAVAQTLGDERWPLNPRKRDVAAALRDALRGVFGASRAFAPRQLVNRLRAVGRHFRRGRQEDAHEFLRALLDAAEPGFAPLEAPSSKANPVSAIFGGRASSTLCCPKCGYKSATEEPFLDLSLEPKPSLARALDAFTAPEKLDAKNAWRCGGCSEPVRATKRLGVAAAPEALVVHLKRFDARGRVARKVDAHVAFGARLELKTTDGGAASYGLVGVLVHHGQSTHSGHYTAFCRTRSGAWSSFDDDAVRACALADVLRQRAYMLFYARDTRPPEKLVSRERAASIESNNPIDLPEPAPAPPATPTVVSVVAMDLLTGRRRLLAARDKARKRVVAVSHGYPRKLAVGKRRRKRLRLCVVDEEEEEEEEEAPPPEAAREADASSDDDDDGDTTAALGPLSPRPPFSPRVRGPSLDMPPPGPTESPKARPAMPPPLPLEAKPSNHTVWGGFEVGGWDDDDAAAAPRPRPKPKKAKTGARYDAWDRSLDAPRRGNWDD